MICMIEHIYILPRIVPTFSAIPLLIAPPDNESKLALNAQAQALVPEMKKIKYALWKCKFF